MTVKLTEPAANDIARILSETLDIFGPRQVEIYAALMEAAIDLIEQTPFGLESVARDELGDGVRSLRLERVAKRRGSAAHTIYFLPQPTETGTTAILRVLHERMEAARHIARDAEDRSP